jgi:hypothetical protein
MRTILWIARIGSAIIVFFLVVMVVAYALNPKGSGAGSATTGLGLVLFPFGLCVGYATAWRWQHLGGVVGLASLTAFFLVMQETDLIPVLLITGAPAMLYIVDGIRQRRKIPPDPLGERQGVSRNETNAMD